jgi:type I pantothenate kinase
VTPFDAPPPFEVRSTGLGPVADVVRHHLDARGSLRRGLAADGWPRAGAGPFVIGLAGSVAGGKSRVAAELCELVGDARVDVLSTDGFLFPNATLTARGLAARKGFPESYDAELATDVLRRIAVGERKVPVPRYSHRSYDIDGPPQVVDQPDVLVVEGVNALQPPIADFCSIRVYLDADEADLRRWYVDRFLELVEEAEGFFAQWKGMPVDDVRRLATTVWEHVNLPNLTEHILPTRWTADVVVRKAADHSVAAVAVRVR